MILLEEIPNFQKLRYCDTDTSDTSDTVFLKQLSWLAEASFKIFQIFLLLTLKTLQSSPEKVQKRSPTVARPGLFDPPGCIFNSGQSSSEGGWSPQSGPMTQWEGRRSEMVFPEFWKVPRGSPKNCKC